MKVSIIVLLYNSEKYLKECLDSVVNQTYKNIEVVIVVNGHCRDNTEQIARHYSEKDERIIVVKNVDNSIITEGLKLGFKNMSGDYFAILEGDDYFLLDAIENLVNEITDTEIDIVTGQIVSVDENGRGDNCIGRPDFQLLGSNAYLEKSIPYMDYLTHGKLFKLTLYDPEAIILPPVFLGHDVLIVYQLALKAQKIKNTEQKVHCFRQNMSSVSHNMTIERLENSFDCHLIMRDILSQSDSKNDRLCFLMQVQLLRILTSCLISGKREFYKKYETIIVEILNDPVLEDQEAQAYLDNWKGVLFILKLYKKYPDQAHYLIQGVDYLRKLKNRLTK